MRETLNQLFPGTGTFVIFVAYMALFINLGLLVQASKDENGKLKYNPITVVLLTECTKLVAAMVFYLREGAHTFQGMMSEIKGNRNMAMLYFVPAGMYALYNILTYYNLQNYDPTTYFMLLQFRVVVTGVVFQLLFKKQLTMLQWSSLILLTVGCMIKQYKPDAGFELNFALGLILVQVLCSCFAGVFNEYLLKGKGGDVHLMIQNVYMYGDSIVVNLVLLGLQGGLASALSAEALDTLYDWKVLALIINNASIGIVVSLFLKNLNSILKTFASALELMFTGVLSWMLFGIPLDFQTVIAIMIISASLYVYAWKPVVNTESSSLPK